MAVSISGFSCYQTYQCRLFPVGYVKAEMYFMQVELVRQAENKNLWKGVKCILKYDGTDYVMVGSKDSVSVSGDNYTTDIEKQYHLAKKSLDSISGIQFYESVSVKYVFHKEKSESVSIKRDSETQFSLNEGSKSFPVKLPDNTEASRQLVFVGGWSEPFRINSVRSLSSENVKWKIVNVGTGEVESTDMKDQMKKLLQFRNEIICPELVLYHGFCIDVIIPSE